MKSESAWRRLRNKPGLSVANEWVLLAALSPLAAALFFLVVLRMPASRAMSLSLAITAAAFAQSVSTNYMPGTDFSGYHSYRWVAVEGSATYDVAFDELNEALLRFILPLPSAVELSAEARRYSPFFELWTIWGAFSPTGFSEGRISAGCER